MKTHLLFDTISGIFLAASPWIFGFANAVYMPHLIFGLLEIGVVLMSKTHSEGYHNHSGITHSSAI